MKAAKVFDEASVNSVPSIFPEYGGMSEYFPKTIHLNLNSMIMKT